MTENEIKELRQQAKRWRREAHKLAKQVETIIEGAKILDEAVNLAERHAIWKPAPGTVED